MDRQMEEFDRFCTDNGFTNPLWYRDQVVEFVDAFLEVDPLRTTVDVVGHHVYKSMMHPVIRIRSGALKTTFYGRFNGHDWAITCLIEVETMRQGQRSQKTEEALRNVFALCELPSPYARSGFEGFDRSGVPVYGGWEEDPTHFSSQGLGVDRVLLFLRHMLPIIQKSMLE